MSIEDAPGGNVPLEPGKGKQMYELHRDGKFVMGGTEVEVWAYLLKHQSSSVAWACAYEGYAIIPREEDGEDKAE